MCRIVWADRSPRPAPFAETLSLCSLIAAMIGAAFMKLGRAPTTVRIIIRQTSDQPIPWSHVPAGLRSEEHTSELQSHLNLVCRLLLEKKKPSSTPHTINAHIPTPCTSCTLHLS